MDHTGHFPGDWIVGDADEFFAHERSILNLAFATIRAYQTHLKVFCDFLTDPVYEWDRICSQGFGRSPAQIITEFNRARHAQNNEQAPTNRTFSRAELQGFFDLADLEVERVLASGRKGAVAAYRDATVFKTAYAWGLRANEVTHLQTVDFARNRRAPQFGEFGVLQVRYGKAQRGSPPKRRSVLTVFNWSPAVRRRGPGAACLGWPRPSRKSSPLPTACRFPSPTCIDASATISMNSAIRRAWTSIRCGGPTSRISSSTSASTTPWSSGRSATNTPPPRLYTP
ncbi:hypothetical protein GCM10009712_05120 [Pseudarthrobacter sulfonivorans]|nr:hypothetical protein [Pseudarthrobacter sulfonivorans]